MKLFLRDINPFFFYCKSRQYMAGYSNYYFYTHFPAALLGYYKLMFLDFLKTITRG